MAQAREASPSFSREAPPSGIMVEVAPGVRRLVCPNASPFTQTGTCTYVVGRGHVAVIDPGPDHAGHVAALVAELADESVEAILVTHTHRDHSPGARRLKALTGAPILGCGPHRPARALAEAETNLLDAASDAEHAPDRILREGEAATGPGWTLAAIETPGHTMNHLCLAHPEANVLFSGDHVMAWSTSIVAPPDGSMAAYMASLDKLRGRGEATYFPGHGGPVREPARLVRALAHHRRQREAAILAQVAGGEGAIPTIVAAVYPGLNPALAGAAGLSVFAHLESLIARGLVVADGDATLAGAYRAA